MSIIRASLSGKTNWRPIPLSEDGTPGNVIHTATSTSGFVDEVWFWCSNFSGAIVNLWTEFDDGVTVTEELVALPSTGKFLICPGITYAGGLIIRAYVGAGGATDGTVTIDGYINRMDQN